MKNEKGKNGRTGESAASGRTLRRRFTTADKTIQAIGRSSVYFKIPQNVPRNFGHKHRRNSTLIGDLFAEIRARNDARLVNKNHPPFREHVELDEEALWILSFYYT